MTTVAPSSIEFVLQLATACRTMMRSSICALAPKVARTDSSNAGVGGQHDHPGLARRCLDRPIRITQLMLRQSLTVDCVPTCRSADRL